LGRIGMPFKLNELTIPLPLAIDCVIIFDKGPQCGKIKANLMFESTNGGERVD